MNHRAQPLSSDWPARRAFVPQGCDQQGRQEPTIPVVIDRVREAYDEDDKREAMSGYEAMCVVAAVIVSAAFSTWALCVFARHLAAQL